MSEGKDQGAIVCLGVETQEGCMGLTLCEGVGGYTYVCFGLKICMFDCP